MNNFFETHNKKDCNGCGVCALICPKGAITMKEDEEGFLYPKIDREKCVHCNLCEKKCPNNPSESKTNQKTYISYCKDGNVKENSASGGMFYPIAKYIIGKNGIVFGVCYDDNLIAHHEYVTTLEGLKKFQGSKYVRSDLRDSYRKVEEFLKQGKYVMFTGTPCQCQGLRAFLKKEYDKLITCEIICHANPSPKILKLYKRNLEIKYGRKVAGIYFKSKENGWKNPRPIIKYIDGTKKEEGTYQRAFVYELINRPSCYDCRFCTTSRYSDFSIGDLWGIDKIDATIKDDDTGISLLNVNTPKGFEILDEIKDDLYLKEADTEQVFSYNHHCNVQPHKNREVFFKGISDGTINENNIIKYMNKYVKVPLYKKIINKSKRVVKKIIKK